MEKVFWLMWLSDIVGSISVVGVVAAICTGLGCVVMGSIAAAEGDAGLLIKSWKVMRWMLLVTAVAVVTPNQRTIQILAVSSAADAVASTQLGAKSLQAINAVLDRVIAEAAPKK